MRNFQQGKIYKIVNIASDDAKDCYIGSTCDLIANRFSKHKQNWRSGKYDTILLYQQFTEVGIDNFTVILVENVACVNNKQLLEREEYHRIETSAKYNMKRAQQTEEQFKQETKENNKIYWQNNKEKLKEYSKEFRKQNSVRLAAIDKQYYEAHKEEEKANRREYRKNNKEIISIRAKEHREKNIELIRLRNQIQEQKARDSPDIDCGCGGKYKNRYKSKHFKSMTHILFVNQPAQ